MNVRRLAIVMLVFSGSLMLMLWYVNTRQRKIEQPRQDQTKLSDKNPQTTTTATTSPKAPAPTPTTTPAPVAQTPISSPVIVKPDQTAPWRDLRGVGGQKYLLGSLNPKDGYCFQVELITDGSAVNTVKLSNFYISVYDKRLADAGWDAYNKALHEHPEKHKGAYSLMNPVAFESKRYLPLATRKVTITFADGTGRNWKLGNLPWKFQSRTMGKTPDQGDTISFSWQLFRGDKRHPVLKLTKTYTIHKGDYTIYVSLAAENLSGESMTIALDQAGPTGAPREGSRSDMRKVAFGYVVTDEKDGEQVQVGKESRPGKIEKMHKAGEHVSVGTSNSQKPVVWIGQTNKFFGSMMYLVPTLPDRLAAPAWSADFYYEDVRENATSPTQLTGVSIKEIKLKSGQTSKVNFEIFAGPKRRDMFVDKDAPYFRDRYRQLDYVSTIDLKSCFCGWDWLSIKMMQMLRLLSVVTFGNYGLAIFVLVIIVRLVLHPLTKRGQVSMAKMKKLGPQMKELEKKYAGDKAALNRERMKMYKTQGATPLLGCLPMLLQMPILISLWTGIRASIDLRHAAFLPVWIIDLAAPDALFSWSKELPLIGTQFNLLPILLGVAMYWQMKLNPQTNQIGASPEQQKQQKMMAIMMPLLMPIMFYGMASGLTLYFLASTFFGAAEQQVIRKHIEEKEAAAAASETTIAMPGRGPRGSRPKKPKGPFWFKKS